MRSVKLFSTGQMKQTTLYSARAFPSNILIELRHIVLIMKYRNLHKNAQMKLLKPWTNLEADSYLPP